MEENLPEKTESLGFTAATATKSGFDDSQHQKNTAELVAKLLAIYGLSEEKRLNQNLVKIVRKTLETQAMLKQLQNRSPLDALVYKIKQTIIEELANKKEKREKIEFYGNLCGVFGIQLCQKDVEALIGEQIFARDDCEFQRLDGEALHRGIADLRSVFESRNIQDFQQFIGCTNWQERFQIAQAYGATFSADLFAAFRNKFLYTLFFDKYEALTTFLHKHLDSPQTVVLILLLDDQLDRRILIETYYARFKCSLLDDLAATNQGQFSSFAKKVLELLLNAQSNEDQQLFDNWKAFFEQVMDAAPDFALIADALVTGSPESYCSCSQQLEKHGSATLTDFLAAHLQGMDWLLASCLHKSKFGAKELVDFFIAHRSSFCDCDFAIGAFHAANIAIEKDQFGKCSSTDQAYRDAVLISMQLYEEPTDVVELPIASTPQEVQNKSVEEEAQQLEQDGTESQNDEKQQAENINGESDS